MCKRTERPLAVSHALSSSERVAPDCSGGVLDHLNSRCSRVTVSLPRVARLKRRDPQVVNEMQKNFNTVMAAVLEFFEEPNPDKLPDLKQEIYGHLCEIAALKRAVERFEQKEMFSA